jgi:reactive intermediate/imine deaminase
MKEMVEGLPTPSGPYSHAVVAEGRFLFLSGQTGRDPDTGGIPADLGDQTRAALENMKAVLSVGGARLEDVVRVLVFLAPEQDRAAFNNAYAGYFSDAKPVRTTVHAGLAPGVLVELEAIAVVGSSSGEG